MQITVQAGNANAASSPYEPVEKSLNLLYVIYPVWFQQMSEQADIGCLLENPVEQSFLFTP